MAATTSVTWKRPESVPFPSVWRRCVGKRVTEDGKILKFKIQDIPEDMFDDIINVMTTQFLRDEYVCSNMKVAEDPTSVREFHTLWRKTLSQKVGLVALVDEDSAPECQPRIAAVNVTGVTLKSDRFSSDMFEGGPIRSALKFSYDHAVSPNVDICEHFGVDAYMSAVGLLVLPEFRGQGLSEEILKARFPLCKAVGLKAMMTLFSATAAQIAAEKAGMKMLHEEFYEDYEEDGKKIFKNIKTKSIKVMACAV